MNWMVGVGRVVWTSSINSSSLKVWSSSRKQIYCENIVHTYEKGDHVIIPSSDFSYVITTGGANSSLLKFSSVSSFSSSFLFNFYLFILLIYLILLIYFILFIFFDFSKYFFYFVFLCHCLNYFYCFISLLLLLLLLLLLFIIIK